MQRDAFVGLALLLLMPAMAAQQRAPQNDSIRRTDLRADLFFLAGDSMRGRLTDTEENRATADFITFALRTHGPEAGAGPNGSYFQPYNLMTATLGDGNGSTVDRRRRRGAASARQGRSSIRSGSAPAAAPRAGGLRRLRHQRAAPAVRRLQRRRERQDRPRARSRAGRARPEQPVRRRRHIGAVHAWRKVAGRTGEGRGGRAVRERRPQSSGRRRTSRRRRATYWPEKPPRILNYTLASVGRSHPHSGRADLAGAGGVARRRHRQVVRGAVAVGRDARAASRRSPLPAPASICRPPSIATSCPTATSSRCSKAATRALKNEWVIVTAHYDHNGADATQIFNGADDNGSGIVALHRDRRSLRARGEGGPPAEAERAVRGVELGGARPARRLGVHRAAAARR